MHALRIFKHRIRAGVKNMLLEYVAALTLHGKPLDQQGAVFPHNLNVFVDI